MITFSRLGKYGRLGNQLFQIAATIGIAVKNRHGFIFPEWEYAGAFENALPTGKLPEAKTVRQKYPWYYQVNIGPGNYDLLGYFQVPDFFSREENLVRHYFQPDKSLDNAIKKKYAGVLEENTCSVHLRRGDYIKFKHAWPHLPLSFYHEAMGMFDKDTLFVFFSDDISWCREQFSDRKYFFIEDEPEINDLFLMGKCKNHIIANSSFSWWGAWLNPDKNKRVIAPGYWFGPGSTLNYQKRNYAIRLPDFEVIQTEKLPGRAKSLLIYTFSKTRYFLIYKLKNIIPAVIRKKLINIVRS